MGAGLALSPIHNQWLTDLTTNSKGETWLFLPAIGYLILIMSTGLFLLYRRDWNLSADLGDKHIWLPLLIIVTAIGISGIQALTIGQKLAPLLTGICFFGLYIACQKLGYRVFIPVGIGAVVSSLGVILHAVIYPNELTGGFVFGGNYDIVVGYTMLGAIMFRSKWQWAIILVAFVALLLSGSPEGLFAVALIGVVMFIREYSAHKVIVASIAVAAVVGFIILLNYGNFYSYASYIIGKEILSIDITTSMPREAIGYRLMVIKEAMTHIQILGTGYSITEFRDGIVHNVPLIIVQQLGWGGIIAGMAWLFASIYSLIKTRLKYAWLAVLTLSIFDHYIWTQLAPWWWALIGVSATSTINNDIIIRKY